MARMARIDHETETFIFPIHAIRAIRGEGSFMLHEEITKSIIGSAMAVLKHKRPPRIA
jgi:hypothetical protein